MYLRLPLLFLSMGIALNAHAEKRTPRILIVGDSWAASITSKNRDGFPSPDVFDDVLKTNGLGRYETRGAVTAWGGRKASDWAKAVHLFEIRAELESHPSIDIVHLIIGGNDFLSRVAKESLSDLSETERNAAWDPIVKDIRTIVQACLATRDKVRVVIAGYDYLDFERAGEFWKKNFNGASNEQLNRWLRELGDRKKGLATEIDRCEYFENWGTLQYGPDDPPKSPPLQGSDQRLGMPASISPDGIHPDANGHTMLLQNVIDKYYREWLNGDRAKE